MKSKRQGALPRERPLLGFVTTFPTRDGWRKESAMFPKHYLGAKHRAESLGFCLEEFWLPDPSAGPALSAEMRGRGVQGLIFPPLPKAGLVLQIEWDKFCLVGIGFTLSRPQIHRVASDTYSSMRRALRECHRLGYRRIGVAMTANVTAKVQNRWLGAYAMQLQGLPDLVPIKPLIPASWTEGLAARWIEKWKPDAIVAPSVFLPLEWLGSQGYTVPDDIGLISLGCPSHNSWLSGIYQNPNLLGARAVDVLVGLMERGDYGLPQQPNTLLIEGRWNPGASLREVKLPAKDLESV